MLPYFKLVKLKGVRCLVRFVFRFKSEKFIYLDNFLNYILLLLWFKFTSVSSAYQLEEADHSSSSFAMVIAMVDVVVCDVTMTKKRMADWRVLGWRSRFRNFSKSK